MKKTMSFPFRRSKTSAAYVLGIISLAIYGLVSSSVIPIVNVVAMTIALYAASSIVVGGGMKSFLAILTISILTSIISDICFATLEPFIAFCFTFFILLIAIKYSVIRDHDSGWFGALGAQFIGMILLMIIEIILGMVYLFPF
ncbi:MAG: hypothetical protein JSV58_06575 [Candidatus Bathyarchaeota archaeon]|nr:MAG: hypothetical protein JSV58_06575 [Candidatus Bathyarchaeota archaeon]